MDERLVMVRMTMAQLGSHHQIRLVRVVMLMMLVMDMFMIMRHRLVQMLMMMALGQMQPDTCAHQDPGGDKLPRDRFTRHDGEGRTDEGRDRKIRPRSRRPEIP
jgi:hypothetical protein